MYLQWVFVLNVPHISFIDIVSLFKNGGKILRLLYCVLDTFGFKLQNQAANQCSSGIVALQHFNDLQVCHKEEKPMI